MIAEAQPCRPGPFFLPVAIALLTLIGAIALVPRR